MESVGLYGQKVATAEGDYISEDDAGLNDGKMFHHSLHRHGSHAHVRIEIVHDPHSTDYKEQNYHYSKHKT